VAAKSRKDEGQRLAVIGCFEGLRVTDGSGVGAQGSRYDVMELCAKRVGGKSLEGLAFVGATLSFGADDQGGEDGETSSLGYYQRHRPEKKQRARREFERKNPEVKTLGLRFS